jgi:hypothetical protein
MIWMKIDQACAYAGGISRAVLYGAIRSGRLRCARIGAGRNVLLADTWIDEYLVSTAKDSCPQAGVRPAGAGSSLKSDREAGR